MKFSHGLLLAAAAAFHEASAHPELMRIINEDDDRLVKLGFMQDDNKPPSVIGQPQTCINNKVTLIDEVFDCDQVDFYSFLSLKDLEILDPPHPPNRFRSMDIWGWLSPTGKEFTLITLDNGQAVVDSTDPVNPCIVAKLPTGRIPDRWGDNKVYENVLYHVKDRSGGDQPEPGSAGYGIEVYDLLKFDTMGCSAEFTSAPYVEPDFVYTDHGRSHNLVMNTESGRLYSVGSEECDGGFVIIDIKTNPLEPTFIGCADTDGYTHDGQCLIYDGPDPDHQGKEICLGFNEDTLTIWDLTDASNPIMLSRKPYPNSAYSHQGWVNDDLTKVLLDDELDEVCNQEPQPTFCDRFPLNELSGLKTTSTKVFNIADLDNPFYEGAFVHKDLAIDHNLYNWGVTHRKGWGGNPPMEFYPDPNFAYLHNYLAGLRILDIRADDLTQWTEVGYFDVSPNLTEVAFAGSWSGYMHPSGVYAISSIERGLFLVQPRMAFTPDFPATPSPTFPGPAPPSDDVDVETIALVLVVLAVVLIVLSLLMICSAFRSRRSATAATVEAKETGAPVVGL